MSMVEESLLEALKDYLNTLSLTDAIKHTLGEFVDDAEALSKLWIVRNGPVRVSYPDLLRAAQHVELLSSAYGRNVPARILLNVPDRDFVSPVRVQYDVQGFSS